MTIAGLSYRSAAIQSRRDCRRRNKDLSEIIGIRRHPYLNKLASEGTVLTRIVRRGVQKRRRSDQNVMYSDKVPTRQVCRPNLGAALIGNGLIGKGYLQPLPTIVSGLRCV